MADDKTLPDLLPWDFAPKQVLTPERILQHQAQLIGRKSGFRLKGYLERIVGENQVTFSLMISAPVLNYSVRLISCSHNLEFPYPARVQSPNSRDVQRASGEEQFRDLVSKSLGSDYARSIFQSLIARIGEVEVEADEPAKADDLDSDILSAPE
ncbi:MAG TPA: hypothetical protein VN843_19780 [Anaerolineales bacterium]|nr:hypothetical protein [Anaerolineales bacterium]